MSEQNEMEKIVNPFTGEVTMVEAGGFNYRTDYGLIFTVKGITVDDGEFDVVLYTTGSRGSNTTGQSVYTVTDDEDGNILSSNNYTTQFCESGHTNESFFNRYMSSWKTGTPTHIHFSDCVLEVVRFVGIGYTQGYTDNILLKTSDCLCPNRELVYHNKDDEGNYRYNYELSQQITFKDKTGIIEIEKVIA